MIHSFDTHIAEKYGGSDKATLIHNIVFWIEKNRANNVHFIDGKYWTYNTAKAFHKLFSYMGSERRIGRLLEQLTEAGALEVANHNKDKRDQTKWYTIADEWIYQVYHLQLSNLSNANTKTDETQLSDLSNDNKETDSKQQIVNGADEKQAGDFWVSDDEQKQINSYKNLQADYKQSDIDSYVERYNAWVISTGKKAKIPALAIRRWMSSDGVPRKPSESELALRQFAQKVGWNQWRTEDDEKFLLRIKNWKKHKLEKHFDFTTNKFKTAEAEAKAREVCYANA